MYVELIDQPMKIIDGSIMKIIHGLYSRQRHDIYIYNKIMPRDFGLFVALCGDSSLVFLDLLVPQKGQEANVFMLPLFSPDSNALRSALAS